MTVQLMPINDSQHSISNPWGDDDIVDDSLG